MLRSCVTRMPTGYRRWVSQAEAVRGGRVAQRLTTPPRSNDGQIRLEPAGHDESPRLARTLVSGSSTRSLNVKSTIAPGSCFEPDSSGSSRHRRTACGSISSGKTMPRGPSTTGCDNPSTRPAPSSCETRCANLARCENLRRFALGDFTSMSRTCGEWRGRAPVEAGPVGRGSRKGSQFHFLFGYLERALAPYSRE